MTKNKKILPNIKEKPFFQKDNFVLFHSDCLIFIYEFGV